MSANNVSNILSKTRITKTDLNRARAEALRPEPTDQPGKPVDWGELDAILAAQSKTLTRAAKAYFPALIAELESLKQSSGEPSGDSIRVSPEGAKRPVFINAAGWATESASTAGQPALPAAEEGAYRLALLISQSVQAGKRPAAIDALPLATRAKLADNLLALAKQSIDAGDSAFPGLSLDETKQLRSSAFTTLAFLNTGLKPSGSTAQLQARIHGELVKMAEHEPEKLLGRHFTRLLDRPDYRAPLTSEQAADVKEVFELRHPQKFDVGNILDAQGYISWEHVSGQGENFFKSFVHNIQNKSIAGVKFKKISSSWGTAEFELTFNPPRGENGRVKGIRLAVREFDDDMYATVGKKKGFSYGGHSNIGENQEKSMIAALSQGLKANSPQIAMFDLCAGLDNLDDALENLGNLEVLTTFGSSYFWKGKLTDESGTEFEGVRASEGMETLVAMFESFAREEGYQDMRARVAKEIYNYAHMRNPNVIFPTIEDYREVRWMHLDGDNDGRMDANDLLFQFGLKTPAKDLDREYELKVSGEVEELNGDTVKNAVLDANVATHYNAITEGDAQVEHALQGAGFYASSDPADLVRFTEGTNHDGSKVIEVSVNSGLAHTTREALEGLVQYLAIVDLSDQGKISGLDEVERKLMGLVFAAFRLNYDGKNRMNDQRIWKQLLEVLRLPADLPYGSLASLVDSEHHNYSGNMKIVEDYKALLSPETVAKLGAHGVGRPGDGVPTAPIA